MIFIMKGQTDGRAGINQGKYTFEKYSYEKYSYEEKYSFEEKYRLEK